MLKKRIIPVQLLMGGRLVKSRRFHDWRDVGDPVKSSAVYSSQSADELLFLNIDRGERSLERLAEVIEAVARECFMPVAFGGGIRSFEDAAFLIRNGADKVVINSAAYADPSILSRTAEVFGTQAVIAAIDAIRDSTVPQGYRLYSNCAKTAEDLDLDTHVARCIAAGAGEIFIQSIDHDGMMNGFDLPLIKRVVDRSSVPVIGCGGSGNYAQLRDAFLETDVSALACGSLFNFSDSNPIRAKAYLSNYGLSFKVV
ncbi:MAG: imidazole glycerol phosphate synthase subunit HisF [Gammaproteobacteria bacterium]